MAGTVTQGYSKYVEIAVEQPSEAKINTINTVLLTFTPRTSYPIDVRVVLVPSYFVLKPEWVQGVDAIKTGTGVTFTLHSLTDEKTIRIAIPGSVLDGINTKDGVELIKEVRYVAYPSFGSTGDVEAYELSTLNVQPTEFVNYESPWEVALPLILVFLGAALIVIGGKFGGG